MTMNKNSPDRGSVTVFLCLMSGVILMLIVSLISVMRYRWEKTQIVRSANIAIQAEFCKYYRPLYDRYRMFYYIETNEELLSAGINSYFMKNQNNMPKFLALTLSGADITDKKYALDNNAGNVREQMTEAVKYALGEKAFDKAAEKFIKNEDKTDSNDELLDDVTTDIENKKKDAEIESKVLELLKVVEGVTVIDGDIRCAEHFVKEGVAGKITPDSAGVDSDIIWKKTHKKYSDIMSLPLKLKNIAHKGYEGKTATFPSGEINEWKGTLSSIRDMTMQAYDIAKEINARISESGRGDIICDTALFETYLGENINILDRAIEFAGAAKPSNKEAWGNYMNMADDVAGCLEKYHIKELRFDYSTLNLNKQKDPRDGAGKKAGGILNLLIDDDKDISKKVIAESDTYYRLMGEEEYSETGDTYMFDDDVDGLQQFVGDCKGEDLKTYKKYDISAIGMSLYIDMYFNCFLSDKDKTGEEKTDKEKAEKENVLDYEREYIVAGKAGDEQNLKKVAGDLLMLRTGISMVSILSDVEKRNMAYITAAAIVGFTGMDAIVRIVQYSIIAAWAYEDACVDVALLLAGKKVPYIKNDSTLNVSYTEIPSFGKEFIKNKVLASACKSGMDYEAYINALLLTKKADLKTYRIMDLIQYNIKQNYSKRFSFQDAVYGAEVHISCSKPYEADTTVSYAYN